MSEADFSSMCGDAIWLRVPFFMAEVGCDAFGFFPLLRRKLWGIGEVAFYLFCAVGGKVEKRALVLRFVLIKKRYS